MSAERRGTLLTDAATQNLAWRATSSLIDLIRASRSRLVSVNSRYAFSVSGERGIAASAVGNSYEIVVPRDVLPVQSAVQLLPFSLNLDQMFVKLCSIDSDSALLGSQLLKSHYSFLSNTTDGDLKGNININNIFSKGLRK